MREDQRGAIDPARALRFLADAGEVLSGSLDLEDTIRRVVHLAVPELADWCAVDLIEADGSLRQITSVHPDSAQEELLLELRRRYREEKGSSEGVRHVVDTGEAELATDVTAGPALDLRDDDERAVYDRLSPRSYMIVPLVARGRTIGAMTFLSTAEGRHYGPGDLTLVRQLARRCALAVDNALLYQRERVAHHRAAFLAEAGEILDSSLDYEETLRNVAAIAVPDVADWCAVQMVDEHGQMHQVAVAHVDPDKEKWAWEVSERYPPDPDAPQGPAAVIRTGEPDLLNDISDELLVVGAVDAEHLELLRSLGLTAALTAPLQARGQTFGALMLVSAESGRRFTDDDVTLATELGRRAGLAVENARLYTQRTAIAHSLQRRLLPRSLPTIPGLEIAARYRAAGELIEVGGDFYDVFREDGAWLVLVGDVSGKGAEAAAVTALVRYTLRAVAQHALPLTDVLRSVNEALIDDRQDSEFCTVCLARYAPNGGGEATFDLVLAGHPLPLVLRRDGTVEEVGAVGTLLGVDREPTFVPITLALAPGETLVFYTDGVTEAGAPDRLLGVEGLQAHLVGRSPQTADAVVAEVEAAAITHAGEPRDDMAILAMTARPAD